MSASDLMEATLMTSVEDNLDFEAPSVEEPEEPPPGGDVAEEDLAPPGTEDQPLPLPKHHDKALANSDNEVSSSAGPPAESDWPICKPCNLVLSSPEALQEHKKKSENHQMVTNGFKPSLGSHYCFLCWRGYTTNRGLLAHYNSDFHANQVDKQNVKAIYAKVEDVESEEDGRGRRGGSSSDGGRTNGTQSKRKFIEYPESENSDRKRPHRDERGHDRDRSYDRDRHYDHRRQRDRDNYRGYNSRRRSPSPTTHYCYLCNLVFLSERSERLHRDSQRHLAVVRDKRRPKTRDGNTSPYMCFLCWTAYDLRIGLIRHYSHGEHDDRMRRYGVSRLMQDERDYSDRTPSPPPRDEDLLKMIVLDEVGEEEECERERKERRAESKERRKENTEESEGKQKGEEEEQNSSEDAKEESKTTAEDVRADDPAASSAAPEQKQDSASPTPSKDKEKSLSDDLDQISDEEHGSDKKKNLTDDLDQISDEEQESDKKKNLTDDLDQISDEEHGSDKKKNLTDDLDQISDEEHGSDHQYVQAKLEDTLEQISDEEKTVDKEGVKEGDGSVEKAKVTEEANDDNSQVKGEGNNETAEESEKSEETDNSAARVDETDHKASLEGKEQHGEDSQSQDQS